MSVGFNGIPDATSPGDLYTGILVTPGFRVAYPYTVSVWFKGPYVETRRNDCLVNLAGRSTANSIRLDCHVGQLRHRVNGQSALTTTYVKNNAWTHALAVGASSTDRRIYANGGGMGQSVVNVTPTAGDSATLGAHMSPGINPGGVSDSIFLGQLAEFAVWSSELTEAEIFELGHGANPLDFQLAGLVYYHHLFNDFDLVHGAEINQSGVSYCHLIQVYACPQDHPPLAYAPASVRSVFMPDRGVPPMPPPIDSAPGSMSGRRRPPAPSGLIHRHPPSGLCRGGGGFVDLTTRAVLGGVLPMPVGALTGESAPAREWALTYPAGDPSPDGVTFRSVAVNEDGSALYVHRSAMGGGTLYRSTNMGVTWAATASFPAGGQLIQCDDTGSILITSPGSTVYRSTDGGDSWTDIGGPTGQPIDSLSMSKNGAIIYACAWTGSTYNVYKYSGGSWSDLGRPADSGTNKLIVATDYDGGVLYAGSVFSGTQYGIWEYVLGWTKVYTYAASTIQMEEMITADGRAVARTYDSNTGLYPGVIRQGGVWGGSCPAGPNLYAALAMSYDGASSVLLSLAKEYLGGSWVYAGPDGHELDRDWLSVACSADGNVRLLSSQLVGLTNRSEVWLATPT